MTETTTAPPLGQNEIAITPEEAAYLDQLMMTTQTCYILGMNARQIQKVLLIAAHQYTERLVCDCDKCNETFGDKKAIMSQILCADNLRVIVTDDDELAAQAPTQPTMN